MLVKICGMSEQRAINKASELGVDLCGFIFYPPSSRFVTAEHAACLDTHGMKRVGVFVDTDIEEMKRIADVARLDYLQLHGEQSEDIARVFPAEKVIRVCKPPQYDTLETLQSDIDRYAGSCSLYLLDAGMGCGMTLDWPALRKLRFPHPWLLAGGLGAENIEQALDACAPFGLDLNSRLEDRPGHKDLLRMEQAVAAIRSYGMHVLEM
jgi:phosphoribosylanthranilate isomerase